MCRFSVASGRIDCDIDCDSIWRNKCWKKLFRIIFLNLHLQIWTFCQQLGKSFQLSTSTDHDGCCQNIGAWIDWKWKKRWINILARKSPNAKIPIYSKHVSFHNKDLLAVFSGTSQKSTQDLNAAGLWIIGRIAENFVAWNKIKRSKQKS